MAAAQRIGQCRPPVDLSLGVDDILKEATWSHFEKWRNRDAMRSIRAKAKKLISDTAKAAASRADVSFGEPGAHIVRLGIPDVDSKGKLIEALRKWKGPYWTEPDGQMELFDGPSAATEPDGGDTEVTS